MTDSKTKFDRNTTLCFSGHRYYPGSAAVLVGGAVGDGDGFRAGDAGFSAIRTKAEADETRLAAAVEAAFADGYRTFISGMAVGFDLAAAEAVLRFRESQVVGSSGTTSEADIEGRYRGAADDFAAIRPVSAGGGSSKRVRLVTVENGDSELERVRLVAAVPFAGQAAGYSPTDRARYEAILAEADEVIVLAEDYSHGCYYRRDDWMVDRSGRVICWYDGTGDGMKTSGAAKIYGGGVKSSDGAKTSGGGTRYTVRRALAKGLEVVNLFRAAGELF
jgi:uncharacterized phage-like protein YoqJ